jgi:hypothetical protein
MITVPIPRNTEFGLQFGSWGLYFLSEKFMPMVLTGEFLEDDFFVLREGGF